MLLRLRTLVLAVFGLLAGLVPAQQAAVNLWHLDGWTAANTSFSRDGSSVLVWNQYGFAVYNASTGAVKAYVGTAVPILGACISKNGAEVYYSSSYQLVAYNVATNTQSYPSITYNEYGPLTLCLSEDGTTLGFVSATSPTITATLVNLSDYSIKATFQVKPASGQIPQTMAFVDAGSQVVFDGPTVYTTGGTLVGSVANTSPVAVSPDEKTLYCAETAASAPTLAAYSTSNLALKWSTATSGALSGPAPSANGAAVYVGIATPGNWFVQGYAASTGHALPNAYHYALSTTAGELPAITASPVNTNVMLGPGTQDAVDGLGLLVQMNSSAGTGVAGRTLFEGLPAGAYSVRSGTEAEFAITDNYGSQSITTLRDAHTAVVNAVVPSYNHAISPDATYYLAYVGGGIGIYSVASGKLIATYTPSSSVGLVSGDGWGADSGHLWFEGENQEKTTLYFLTFNGTTATLAATTAGIEDSPLQVAYLADGKHAAELGEEGFNVYIYDVTTGARTATIAGMSAARMDVGSGSLVGLSSSGGNYADGSNEYRVFDVSGAPVLVGDFSYEITANSLPGDGTISPDGRYIVMDDNDPPLPPETRMLPNIRIFRASDGLPLQEWHGLPGLGYADSPPRACISADSLVVTLSLGQALFAFALPPSTMGVSLSANSVPGGANVTGKITFDSPVPVATTINLSSTSKAITTPTSVKVAAGGTSVTFAIQTSGVDGAVSATISAVDSLSPLLVASSPLTLAAPTRATLTLTPNPVVGGSPSTATVKLNADAGPSGVTLNLASSTAVAKVPTSVTVPSGSQTATFTVTTVNPPATTTATITASTSGFQASASLPVVQQAAVALTFGSTDVVGGSAASLTVSLAAPAPAGGATFALSSSQSALAPRASVTVPAGATSVTIGVPTVPVASNTPATLSATQKGAVVATASVTVDAPIVLFLIPSGSQFAGPATGVALVILDGPAASGFTLTASSSNVAVAVPATVSVPKGQTFAVVPLVISGVSTTTTVTVEIGGISCVLTILP